jgi:hypothetical protein
MGEDVCDEEDAYHYRPIDLRALGAEIEYVNFLLDGEDLAEDVD